MGGTRAGGKVDHQTAEGAPEADELNPKDNQQEELPGESGSTTST